MRSNNFVTIGKPVVFVVLIFLATNPFELDSPRPTSPQVLPKQGLLNGFTSLVPNETESAALMKTLHHRRKRIQHFLEHHDRKDTNIPFHRVPSIFPKPMRIDSVQVYNRHAWQDLTRMLNISIVGEQKEQGQLTLCVNGGSATAGGGLDNPAVELFPYRLVEYLLPTNMLLENSNTSAAASSAINIINRGHGFRGSLHSALIFDNYIPSSHQAVGNKPKTKTVVDHGQVQNSEKSPDILIWEFAINDYSGYIRDGTRMSQRKAAVEERNSLIFWLDQVARLQPKPPLVILAYLWKRPLNLVRGTRKFNNPVFAAHERLGARYPFVVGHVNLASYLDELLPFVHFNVTTIKRSFLAEDGVHPTALGHSVLAYLMVDMLRDESRVNTPSLSQSQIQRSVEPIGNTSSLSATITQHQQNERHFFQWTCGIDDKDKQFLKSRLVPHERKSPVPLASFTMEIPKNEFSGSSKTLSLSPNLVGTLEVVNLGKSNPLRHDRQLSFALPCCDGSKTNQTLELVSSSPIQSMQALQLGLGAYNGSIQVHLDGEPASGRLIGVRDWDCSWKFIMYKNLHWLALDEEWTASRIGLCSNDTCCRRPQASNAPEGSPRSCSMLSSLVVF